jgi:hypothetical protein
VSDIAPPPSSTPQPISAEERRAILAQAVATQVRQGSRVETQSEFQAVMVDGKPINHVLHLILTFVTCLTWGLVWIGLVAMGGEKRYSLQVDNYGNILRA